MLFQQENATYKSHLARLLDHEGKYIVIKADKIDDHFFDSYEDVLSYAYEHYEQPFLVKRISPFEVIQHITRHVVPVCH